MRVFFLISSALIAFCSLICSAEIQQNGDYDIHYAVFPSRIIPPEVALAHNLVRADNKIIVNVSVKTGEQTTKAKLSGFVINLLEQVIELEFMEVNEGNAIYYLATHTSQAEDTLRFNLLITPPDSEPFPITFMQRYD